LTLSIVSKVSVIKVLFGTMFFLDMVDNVSNSVWGKGPLH